MVALVAMGCDPGDDGEEVADTEGGTAGAESGDDDGGVDDGGDDGFDEGPVDDGADDDTGGPAATDLPVACPEEDPNPPVYEHFGIVDDQIWTDGIHVIEGALGVAGTLRVEPCVTLAMRPGASIFVGAGGALQLAGEPDRRVLVSSASPSPLPGDWGLIEFETDAVGPNNVIEHATIEYGGDSSRGSMVWVHEGTGASFVGTEVRHSSSFGFGVLGTLHTFEGNVITDNAGAPMYIRANHVQQLGPGVYAPNGEEGIYLEEGWVRDDQTWGPHDTPYVVRDAFGVGTNTGSVQLTIAAGTEIRFDTEAFAQVGDNGGLTMAGTEASPVVLRSSKVGGGPGDWDGVFFEAGSIGSMNDLDWVEIHDAGYGGHAAVWLRDDASAAITNCTISGNADEGIYVDDGASVRDFSGNILTDNYRGIVAVANAIGALSSGVYGPNTVDGIHVLSDRITLDAEWEDLGVPYVSHEGFDIGGNGTAAGLRLTAGACLGLLDASVEVMQGGWLTVEGDPTEPAVVTSGASAGAAGDWESIRFHDGSVGANNLFRHARIEFGGGGSFDGVTLIYGGATLHLDHAVFADSGQGCDIEHVFGTGTVDAVDSVYTLCP